MIIKKNDITEKFKGMFIVADVNIKTAKASYTINEHKGSLGTVDHLNVNAQTPDLPIPHKNWKYDAFVTIRANEEFFLLSNIVRLKYYVNIQGCNSRSKKNDKKKSKRTWSI